MFKYKQKKIYEWEENKRSYVSVNEYFHGMLSKVQHWSKHEWSGLERGKNEGLETAASKDGDWNRTCGYG